MVPTSRLAVAERATRDVFENLRMPGDFPFAEVDRRAVLQLRNLTHRICPTGQLSLRSSEMRPITAVGMNSLAASTGSAMRMQRLSKVAYKAVVSRLIASMAKRAASAP